MTSKHLSILSIVLSAVLLAAAACAETAQQTPAPNKGPQITLAATKVVHPAQLEMKGSGFTPLKNALSHLKKADGSEFPVLTILSDSRGEFTHEIDSLLLAVGTHELWVFDETTGVQSNVVKFDVVRE